MIVPSDVLAQTQNNNQFTQRTLIDRRAPETLKPQGLYYKGFLYRPGFEIEGKYDSNVLTQEDNEISDYSVSVKPSLVVEKEIDAHNYKLTLEGDIERFESRTQENKEEFNLEFRGLTVLNSRWSIPTFVQRRNVERTRSEPAEFLSAEPLDIDYFRASSGVRRQFNRLALTLVGEYEDIEFENGVSEDGSSVVVFSDNNRRNITANLRAEYEFVRSKTGLGSEHLAFSEIFYNRSIFDDRQFIGGSFNGESGSSKDIGFLIGFETKYKGLINGRLALGYISKNFDDPGLSNINELDFDANIRYFLTPKMTAQFQAERFVDQDNGFVNGVTRSRFLTGLDFEVLHNLYLTTNLHYEDFEFEGVDRNNEDFGGGFDIRFLNSQNIQTGLGIDYITRSSNESEEEFDRLQIMLRLISEL